MPQSLQWVFKNNCNGTANTPKSVRLRASCRCCPNVTVQSLKRSWKVVTRLWWTTPPLNNSCDNLLQDALEFLQVVQLVELLHLFKRQYGHNFNASSVSCDEIVVILNSSVMLVSSWSCLREVASKQWEWFVHEKRHRFCNHRSNDPYLLLPSESSLEAFLCNRSQEGLLSSNSFVFCSDLFLLPLLSLQGWARYFLPLLFKQRDLLKAISVSKRNFRWSCSWFVFRLNKYFHQSVQSTG